MILSIVFYFAINILSAQFPSYCKAGKVGVSYGTVSLQKDTFLHSDIIQSFREGEVFEIIDETKEEHLDKSEYQLFKWYKVRTTKDQVGWIFGEGLAIASQVNDIPAEVEAYHFQPCKFNNGFDTAMSWCAAIHGRENLQHNSIMNPPYTEYFLVVINDRKRAVLLPVGSSSNNGETQTIWLKLLDINNDQTAELIQYHKTKGVSPSSPINYGIDIYSFQAGTLVKIFEEFLTLYSGDDQQSIAQQKMITISSGSIRVEYLDFMPCSKYSLSFPYKNLSKSWDHCIEFASQVYGWDKKSASFKSFYSPIRKAPSAKIISHTSPLLTSPSDRVSNNTMLRQNELITIIQMHQSFTPTHHYFFYVKTADGKYGYIRAEDCLIQDCEQGAILLQKANNPQNYDLIDFEFVRFR